MPLTTGKDEWDGTLVLNSINFTTKGMKSIRTECPNCGKEIVINENGTINYPDTGSNFIKTQCKHCKSKLECKMDFKTVAVTIDIYKVRFCELV